jgi:predicted transcriptional regulator
MERSRWFTAIALLALFILAGLLFLAIVSSSPATSGWELYGNGSAGYIYVGSDGTLYAFRGNEIDAILADGTVAWKLAVPGEWRILNNWMMSIYTTNRSARGGGYWSTPVLAEKDRSLYVFAFGTVAPETGQEGVWETRIGVPAMVMKITPAGIIEWTYDFSVNASISAILNPDILGNDRVSISVRNERIYVFHDYGEDVLDSDGHLLFRLDDIADPPAIADDGRIYAVRTAVPSVVLDESSGMDERLASGVIVVGEDLRREASDPSYRIPSSSVVAYDLDGNLAWSRDIGLNVTRTYVSPDMLQEHDGLPLLWDGTLFVPVSNGIVALAENGSVLWSRQIADGTYILFEMMPLDSRGNIYLTSISEPPVQSRMIAISPEGAIGNYSWDYQLYADWSHPLDAPVPLAGRDGVVYAVSKGSMGGAMGKDDFNATFGSRQTSTNTLTAYYVSNGTALWSFAIPSGDKRLLTLNEGNIREAIPAWPYPSINKSWVNVFFDICPMEQYPLTPRQNNIIQVYPGNNLVYLNYDFVAYEHPVIPDRSRAVYIRGIYVLDAKGELLERLAIDGWISEARVSNDTLFYGTDDGKIGGSTVTLAAGLALAAIACVFLKFFVFGSVTRARARLEQNPNRNSVLGYVLGHPGSTTYDISRGLAMNLGTVRYHLLILGINHRIREHRADGKFVRFFPNSDAYTDDERVIISLARRKTMRQALAALKATPGASNHELATALGVSATAASNYMQELSEAGIVEKETMPGNRVAYSIADRYRAITEAVLSRPER